MAQIAVEFRNVTKSFGDLVVNENISFSVPVGSIRALVGENGAGKSTAMKILFGLYKEDQGEIFVHGKAYRCESTKDAIAYGIGMVHQHFMLAETATGLDNIILGEERKILKFPFLPRSFNIINRYKARKHVESLAKTYGLQVPLDVKVSKLPVGLQQRIEILKLLYREANILILDEPTAVLTPIEAKGLFENLKKLREQGKTIIVVTHKLKEVLDFSDEITVFRAGKVVGALKTQEATEERIASLMIGRNIDLHLKVPPSSKVQAELLYMEKISLRSQSKYKSRKSILKNLNLSVRSGEIVGIAGIEGNGQAEFVNLLLNPRRHFFHTRLAQGDFRLFDRDATGMTSHQIRRLPIGVIPEDRIQNGLLLSMDAKENYILGRHRERKFLRSCFLSKKKIEVHVLKEMENYDVRPRQLGLALDHFSGGNQQKLIVAREIDRLPQLMIVSNPTRGVDIGAIEFIHKKLVSQRDKGVGLILISSELDELLTLSDRILVMYEGEFVQEFQKGQADENRLGLAMCGGVRL